MHRHAEDESLTVCRAVRFAPLGVTTDSRATAERATLRHKVVRSPKYLTEIAGLEGSHAPAIRHHAILPCGVACPASIGAGTSRRPAAPTGTCATDGRR